MKLAATATHFSEPNSPREAMIIENLGVVKSVARRLHRRLPPCVTLDDLAGAGAIGLVEAAGRFDPSCGVTFKTYARHRVLGAMLDFLRSHDPLPRGERRRLREAPDALSRVVIVSLDRMPAPDRLACIDERIADKLAEQSQLNRARQNLTPAENRVIALLFDFDWSPCRIATLLGVHASRVSQIKHSALAKLRLAVQGQARAA